MPRCLTANLTCVWKGSNCQRLVVVPCASFCVVMSLPPLKYCVWILLGKGKAMSHVPFPLSYFLYGNKYKPESSFCQGCCFSGENMVYSCYEYTYPRADN